MPSSVLAMSKITSAGGIAKSGSASSFGVAVGVGVGSAAFGAAFGVGVGVGSAAVGSCQLGLAWCMLASYIAIYI